MYEERLLLSGGFTMQAVIREGRDFVLSLRKGENVLVEYSSAGGYEFKSVEKLRYDFQRDAEDAIRRG